jgi:succinoglycan biosynthesis transport protein ExoP
MEDEELLGILARLRRRKFVFVGVFTLTLALFGAVYAILPRSYMGQAAVMLAITEPPLGGNDSLLNQKHGDPADVESQMVVLGSFNLLQKVVSHPDIAAIVVRECEARNAQPIRRVIALLLPADCHEYSSATPAAQYLQSWLNVSESGRSRVITVSYSSPLPEVSQMIPNAVANAYVATKLQDKLDSRLAAIAWLRSEIANISADLADTEAKIDAFNREHGLVRGQNSSLASEQLTAISLQLAAARDAKSLAEAKLGQLASGADSAPEALDNRAIGDIKQQLADVIGRSGNLENQHGPAYPALAGLLQQKSSLSERLEAETSRIGKSLRQEYEKSTSRVAALEEQLEKAKQAVAAGTGAEIQIASLQRHADVQRELYIDLSKKLDSLETERRVLSGNVHVVSYAQLPRGVAFPRKLPFILGGLMLAAGAGVGTTLLVDRGDRSVRSKWGLQVAAGAPVLAYIPTARRTQLASCREVLVPCELQEAVRDLYAHCVLMQETDRPQCVLVSSALPGDGKTFVTLALAQFAAASGARVLAIEADLRRPDFHRALEETSGTGLSAYLCGVAECEQVVQRSQVPGLDVILAGEPALNSTELLSNGRFDELLRWARSRYEFILVDSPPSRVLVDAQLLATRVDGVLYCARWGVSDTRVVSNAVHELASRGAHVIGIAIDRANARQVRFFDGYGGYYAYMPGRKQLFISRQQKQGVPPPVGITAAFAEQVTTSGGQVTLSSGAPIFDSSGYITPQAWKAFIDTASKHGLSRAQFIKEFGCLLQLVNGAVPVSYGLTRAERKLMG